jgi:hypothetical protein
LKIAEVKEVIQNRSNNEIEKVLVFYDFDVGKTINAFIDGTAKETLSKAHGNQKTPFPSSETVIDLQTSDKPASQPNKNNNAKTKSDYKNSSKFNVNDIVNSVIDKYTAMFKTESYSTYMDLSVPSLINTPSIEIQPIPRPINDEPKPLTVDDAQTPPTAQDSKTSGQQTEPIKLSEYNHHQHQPNTFNVNAKKGIDPFGLGHLSDLVSSKIFLSSSFGKVSERFTTPNYVSDENNKQFR